MNLPTTNNRAHIQTHSHVYSYSYTASLSHDQVTYQFGLCSPCNQTSRAHVFIDITLTYQPMEGVKVEPSDGAMECALHKQPSLVRWSINALWSVTQTTFHNHD